MNPSLGPNIDVKTLLALRREADAVRLITERLKVKEMGPADHIRTKHEVKAFIESGNADNAETLLRQAETRRTAALSESQKHTISRAQRP
jgi:hypothetical protein